MFENFTSLELRRNDVLGTVSDEECLHWITLIYCLFKHYNSKSILQHTVGLEICHRNSSPTWLLFFEFKHKEHKRRRWVLHLAVSALFCWIRPPDRQQGSRDYRSINRLEIHFMVLPVHLLHVRSSANASLYAEVTCDLSLNTDSHTGFFWKTAVGLCPATYNERCTCVLHLLPLRSSACMLIALFYVVFHPVTAVHNSDRRSIRNWTYNKRLPVECDMSSVEQQHTHVFDTNTRRFSRSKLFSSVECSKYRFYRAILSVLDPRKCEYLKDYSLDFEHAYMTTYLASWEACRY